MRRVKTHRSVRDARAWYLSARSAASQMRKDRRGVMAEAGVPFKVAELLVRISVPLATLSSMGASWACGVCADYSVELSVHERAQLSTMCPDPATSSVGARSVPLAEQTPARREPPQPEPRPFYYYACGNGGCKCESSYNGAPRQACCRKCRDLHPCDRATDLKHDFPSEVPAGFVALPMPTSKKALAKAYCDLPHIGAKPTPLLRRYTKEQLQSKLWEAQFHGGAAGVAFACRAADDDDEERSDASMHDLLSSDDTSDGVSVEEEVVEVGAPATAPQAPRLSKGRFTQ